MPAGWTKRGSAIKGQPAAGPFLRGLGDLEDRGPIQGRIRLRGLVAPPRNRHGRNAGQEGGSAVRAFQASAELDRCRTDTIDFELDHPAIGRSQPPTRRSACVDPLLENQLGARS